MKKKGNLAIWIIAIVLLLTAASIVYMKYKPQVDAQQQANQKTMAPDFSLKDLNGKSVKLSDYKGKIVILNFWAVWCQYCKQEMPDLNELSKTLERGNDVVFLAVDVQESQDTVKSYLDSNKISLHVLFDSDGSVAQAYGITGFPTTFILNRDGTLFTYIPRATTKEELSGIISKVK